MSIAVERPIYCGRSWCVGPFSLRGHRRDCRATTASATQSTSSFVLSDVRRPSPSRAHRSSARRAPRLKTMRVLETTISSTALRSARPTAARPCGGGRRLFENTNQSLTAARGADLPRRRRCTMTEISPWSCTTACGACARGVPSTPPFSASHLTVWLHAFTAFLFAGLGGDQSDQRRLGTTC